MSARIDATASEDEYAKALTAGGVDPVKAREVARKTVGKRKSDSQTDDLFGVSVEPARTPSTAIAPPTPRDTIAPTLLDAASTIGTEPPSGSEIAYLHTILCQVGLPRGPKAVEGLTVFERMCGGAALRVTAGALWDGKQLVQQPIPYGANPRLVLAWLNTQAVKTRSPIIPVGDSATEFLRMLGKETTGGKNGTLTSFKGVLSRNRRKFRQPINVACPSPGRWGRPNSRVTSRHFDHGNASRMSRPDCSGLDGAD